MSAVATALSRPSWKRVNYDSDAASSCDDSSTGSAEMLEDATELGHLRIPSCKEVLDAIRENHVLLLMFQDSRAFRARGDQDVLFDVGLWKSFR
eukprot:scaffold384243_cov76-Cyclotella_meneghiniana.AAC.1